MIYLSDVLHKFYPNTEWGIDGNCYEGLHWSKNNIIDKPTEEEINAKITELQAAEPLRQLRIKRNQLLAETDWRFRSDLEPSQAWIDYCQALRDLPANSEPQLDENGQLTNITWPEKPE